MKLENKVLYAEERNAAQKEIVHLSLNTEKINAYNIALDLPIMLEVGQLMIDNLNDLQLLALSVALPRLIDAPTCKEKEELQQDQLYLQAVLKTTVDDLKKVNAKLKNALDRRHEAFTSLKNKIIGDAMRHQNINELGSYEEDCQYYQSYECDDTEKSVYIVYGEKEELQKSRGLNDDETVYYILSCGLDDVYDFDRPVKIVIEGYEFTV